MMHTSKEEQEWRTEIMTTLELGDLKEVRVLGPRGLARGVCGRSCSGFFGQRGEGRFVGGDVAVY